MFIDTAKIKIKAASTLQMQDGKIISERPVALD